MVVKEFGNAILVKLLHPRKVLPTKVVTVLGKLMDLRELQSSKA
jgi:hypothetical protein